MLLFHQCPQPLGATRPERHRAWRRSTSAQGWSCDKARALDEVLSARPLTLDSAGYFVISCDHNTGTISAQHYANTVNEQGLACDPVTGEVIPCKGYVPPPPTQCFSGSTAKEVAVLILEGEGASKRVTRLEHAAYLGRELQKAEDALRRGNAYWQD